MSSFHLPTFENKCVRSHLSESGISARVGMFSSSIRYMRRKLAEACLVFFVNFGAFNLERFGRVFGRDLRATVDPFCAIACGPANGIAQNQPDVLIIIDWIGFVAGTEVKDFAVAAFPGAPRTENLAALEPGDENNLVGR